jgi:rRNA maturation endonuclease Nob1
MASPMNDLAEMDETPVMVECDECGEIFNSEEEEDCPYCGGPLPW